MSENNSSRFRIPRWARRLLYTLVFILAIYSFKGSIYRTCVSYELYRPRNLSFNVKNSMDEMWNRSDSILSLALDSGRFKPLVDEKIVTEIIDRELDSTSGLLEFTMGGCSTKAEFLRKGGKTNCVGYSDLFAARCNSDFEKKGLGKRCEAVPYIAELHVFGFNIHQLFSNPFWKDHDVVLVMNHTNREFILVDPTLYDYSGIGIVKQR